MLKPPLSLQLRHQPPTTLDLGSPNLNSRSISGECGLPFKHQNPQTQPSSHLHGDMWAALCSHFLTFIQQQKNVIISIKIHILKYSKITCKEKQLFQRMRRFQFAIGFWRQGTGQTLWWPWHSVEAERSLWTETPPLSGKLYELYLSKAV